MPRPCRKKCVSSISSYTAFIHTGGPIPTSHVQISVEEYGTIHLIDYLEWNQEECTEQMQTSRGSVQSLYNEVRRKLPRFLTEDSITVIADGNYQLSPTQKPTGNDSMKITVTCDNGQVFQHFGCTQMLKFYEATNQEVITTRSLDTSDNGHSALVALLKADQVDTPTYGGIGGGARNVLVEVGIELYGGACGDADVQVTFFLDGNLRYSPNIQYSHHGEGYTCGSHKGRRHSYGSSHLQTIQQIHSHKRAAYHKMMKFQLTEGH